MLFISAYGGILIAGCPKLAHYSWDVSLGFLIQPWPQKVGLFHSMVYNVSVDIMYRCLPQ
jgi:hypothetical protein